MALDWTAAVSYGLQGDAAVAGHAHRLDRPLVMSAPLSSLDLSSNPFGNQGVSRPITANVPLSPLTSLDVRGGKLQSPLHPDTHHLFQHSRRRNAYGSVAPHNVPLIRHQPAMYAGQHEEEARRTWFKAYANDTDKRAHSAVVSKGSPRGLGASGPHGHLEENEVGAMKFQSWRGWTSSSRHNHEQRMRQVWMDEARQNWRSQHQSPETSRREWRSKMDRPDLQEGMDHLIHTVR